MNGFLSDLVKKRFDHKFVFLALYNYKVFNDQFKFRKSFIYFIH